MLFTDCVNLVGSACKPFEGEKYYVSTGTVDNDHIDYKHIETINYSEKPSRANLEVKTGDVLFAKMQGTKKTLLIDEHLSNNIYSTGFCAVRAKDDILTTKCLYYILTSEIFLNQKDNNCSGATQRAITNSGLKKIVLQVPDLRKQESITNQLDLITGIINKRQQELQELDELIKARFVEMFEVYEKVDLSAVADITMGQSPDSKSYNNDGNGIPFFQGKTDFGDKYTMVSHWTTEPNKIVEANSILMSVRAPVGPVNIANTKCCIGRGLCGINSKEELTNNEFLYNALKAMEYEISTMGSGSTFKAITKSDVYKLQVPKAPIELQNEFSWFSEQVDKSKFTLEVAFYIERL